MNIIIQRVKKSKIYSIMFDETTDISHESQLTLILRYNIHNGVIREDFFQFIDLRKEVAYENDEEDNIESIEPIVTEVKIGEVVLNILKTVYSI